MSALDAVMKYRAEKQARADQEAQNIPNAVMGFLQGTQQRDKMIQQQFENQKSMMDQQLNAAKSGFKIQNGQLVPDETYQQNAQRSVYSFNPLTGQLEQAGTIKKGDAVRNTLSPEDIQKKEQAKYDGTKETSSRAFDLRKEFQATDTVRDFQVIKNQVSGMDALMNNLKDEKSRLALDQGLITLFNKITDPTSVVRESEYERTPQNLSLINRFSGAIEKLEKGGAGLTNEDRQSLVFGAKTIAKARGDIYNKVLDNYSNLATEFGVKPELVTSGYGRYEDSSAPSTNYDSEKEARYQAWKANQGAKK